MRAFKKWMFSILAGILASAALLVVFLTVTEYRPADRQGPSYHTNAGSPALTSGQTLTVISYNTGYAGLDSSADFFMDGGIAVRPKSRSKVEQNLGEITRLLQQNPADIYLLQEVDLDSKRSYHINQAEHYEDNLTGYGLAFAYNYKCNYVPYPLPPIGRVQSGLLTLSAAPTGGVSRIALPCPFNWPVRVANLKRCLLETRYPIEGSDRELVIYNLHLEAYDDGEGKRAQTELLMELIGQEYACGNYIIAGGDFNQAFPGSLDSHPLLNTHNWAPGLLSPGDLPEGFCFAADLSTPSCRLLDAPYDPSASQTYVIDGFIISPNVELLSVETLNTAFRPSDHQPVKMQFALLP